MKNFRIQTTVTRLIVSVCLVPTQIYCDPRALVTVGSSNPSTPTIFSRTSEFVKSNPILVGGGCVAIFSMAMGVYYCRCKSRRHRTPDQVSREQDITPSSSTVSNPLDSYTRPSDLPQSPSNPLLPPLDVATHRPNRLQELAISSSTSQSEPLSPSQGPAKFSISCAPTGGNTEIVRNQRNERYTKFPLLGLPPANKQQLENAILTGDVSSVKRLCERYAIPQSKIFTFPKNGEFYTGRFNSPNDLITALKLSLFAQNNQLKITALLAESIIKQRHHTKQCAQCKQRPKEDAAKPYITFCCNVIMCKQCVRLSYAPSFPYASLHPELFVSCPICGQSSLTTYPPFTTDDQQDSSVCT